MLIHSQLSLIDLMMQDMVQDREEHLQMFILKINEENLKQII